MKTDWIIFLTILCQVLKLLIKVECLELIQKPDFIKN